MIQVLLPLLAAIIGALLGMLAGASGPIVRARTAHLQWLRDARGELCDRYYSLLVQTAEGVRAWEEFGSIPASASYRELADATTALQLYCSKGLSEAVDRVAQKYKRWLIWDLASDATLELTLELLTQFSEDFLEEAEKVKYLIQAELAIDVAPTPRNTVEAF